MSAAKLLDRLQGVRQSGPGRWLAICPAHPDRDPSLSIRETGEGRVLLHCFASCSAGDVVAALGLTLADLFDGPLSGAQRGLAPIRAGIHAADALACIQHEALVTVIVAEKLARGEALAEPDHQRLIRAASTITAAVAKAAMPEPPEFKRLRRGEGRNT